MFVRQYIQIMRLDHPLNINKKYEYLCKLYPSETVGEGSRKVQLTEILRLWLMIVWSRRPSSMPNANNSGVGIEWLNLETRTSGEK